MTRLSSTTLHQAKAKRPTYDRARVTPGIVHLGMGNFHRAHQAVTIDDVLTRDPSWGIRGVSLRRPDMRDALAPQDGLYALAVKDGAGTKARIIGSVLDVLVAPEGVEHVLAALCDPAIRLVTLTVTEKGYCHDPATGDLDADHSSIRKDLATPGAPHTVPGIVTEALRRRRDDGVQPFTVLSCDNLPANGRTLAKIVRQYAALVDTDLATWIEAEVAFPSSMVDRIVPATTDQDRKDVEAITGLHDAWPVMAEPFTQWVVEDRFPAGRPDLDAVGVELVDDVEPYENMKLRMLNGAHSTLAYFGQLMGVSTVSEAMADPRLSKLIATLVLEAAGTLTMPNADLAGYADDLQHRFRNPALPHKTVQIAMDGSQKIPQRLLGTIRDAHAAGRRWRALSLGVAAWISYVRIALQSGPVDDPMADRFVALGKLDDDPATHADAMLQIEDVFGDLTGAEWFKDPVRAAVLEIAKEGPQKVLPA